MKIKAMRSIPSTFRQIAVASTVAVVSKQTTVGDVLHDAKNYNLA